MGLLLDGTWDAGATLDTYDRERYGPPTSFDERVRDAEDAPHPVEPGRYHLYVSRACPWAHRTAITRRLLGLEDVVSVDVVDPVRRDRGWEFSPDEDGCTPDSVHGHETLAEVYRTADPGYTGRVTVPALYDREADTVVAEESADIARLFATEFGAHASTDFDLYPEGRRGEIDAAAADVHDTVNTAVYRAGFAESQAAYETAVEGLFGALERWDDRLADRRFAVGDEPTLADVFLFPTLYRFDAVYHTHFKCNVRRLVDFEHLAAYARDVYQLPGVAETCEMDHVTSHYYRSHDHINPTGVVPVGPEQDFSAPHDRDSLSDDVPPEA
jgi:putative glutathione S-transferase